MESRRTHRYIDCTLEPPQFIAIFSGTLQVCIERHLDTPSLNDVMGGLLMANPANSSVVRGLFYTRARMNAYSSGKLVLASASRNQSLDFIWV
jgi:hypothetical protein